MKLRRLLNRRPSTNDSLGVRAETAALTWLQQQGLKALTRNYRCRFGEIDIIGRHGEHLVFVEVRFRSNPRYGGAVESVDARKQQRLWTTAEDFLQRHSEHRQLPCRFDVVVASRCSAGEQFDFYWHQNAFIGGD